MRDPEDLVMIAKALSNETRVKIILTLMRGPATTSDIVDRLGGRQPRISSHLAVLRNSGLVAVAPIGRQRVYRIRSNKTETFLKKVVYIPRTYPRESYRGFKSGAGKINPDFKAARACYDHLAGVAGVMLLDLMISKNWLTLSRVRGRPTYELTSLGEEALAQRGVEVDKRTRRQFAFGCPDWTEKRFHLGGELGRAVLQALLKGGLVAPRNETRELEVRAPVRTWVELPDKRGSGRKGQVG